MVGINELGRELPAAAAFPEMADNARGVFIAAFGKVPLSLLGTTTLNVHPKHPSCPRPEKRAPEILKKKKKLLVPIPLHGNYLK